MAFTRRTACAVCGSSSLGTIAELPHLPLTALFVPPGEPTPNVPTFDQALLFCPACGHAQLRHTVPPEQLYDTTYSFRTSLSGTARRGTRWFLDGLDEVAADRRFNCAMDVGCNDLHLLTELGGRASRRIGVDPLWRGREEDVAADGIEVIGATVEELTVKDVPARPDLIVCRHTLEHVPEPRSLFARLTELAAPDALFVFELPSFEPLVERLRFDQVFHQHLHLFSRASLARLAAGAGLRPVQWRLNYHDWGALWVTLERGPASSTETLPFDLAAVQRRWQRFAEQTAAMGRLLEELRGEPAVGYGAAQMLPVIAYHLGTDLGLLDAVIDDDPAKDGWRYANLPLTIRSMPVPDDAVVVLTAVDNAAPILTRLLADPPRRIIYPLAVI